MGSSASAGSRILPGLLVALLPALLAQTVVADTATNAALRKLESGQTVERAVLSRRTGQLLSLRLREGRASARGTTNRATATAFLRDERALFGWSSSDQPRLHTAKPNGAADAVGMEHFRVEHIHRGLTVRGSTATIHVKAGAVVGVLATTARVDPTLDVEPTLDGAAAIERATELVRATYGADPRTTTPPELEILIPSLFGEADERSHLVWHLEAELPGIREQVWIDAHSGEPTLHFNALPDALARRVFDGQGTPSPAILVRSEGDPASGDTQVDQVYDFAGDTYDYFLDAHGRDSWDGNGAPMDVTVRSCFCGCPCLNAFWVGSGTIIGYIPGIFLGTDDIVGHEFTHGVTQSTANLIYFRESGALNESFSDIFGEVIDLTNGRADTPGGRWLIMDDIAPSGLRNMADPTLLGSPGKRSDPEYFCGSGDSGGVHTNSGVLNHAFALTTDGGSYNGFDIEGIGLEKTAKIYYRALEFYLTPTSGFFAAYHALEQACADLVGTELTTSECEQSQAALDAVEMRRDDPCRLCPSSPPEGCTAPAPGARSSLRLRDGPGDDDRMEWRIREGAAVAPEELEDPTTRAEFAVCLYDSSPVSSFRFLRMTGEVPAGGTCAGRPCWRLTERGGVRYVDPRATAAGVARILMRPHRGESSQLRVLGFGSQLELPPLDALNTPVTMTLTNRLNSQCWQSTFDEGELRRGGTVWHGTARGP